MKPRIFVGMPCYGPVSPEVLQDFSSFTYHLGRRMTGFDFFTGIKSKTEQFRARNAIVAGAIQAGCEWLLMLDDDMLINTLGEVGYAGVGAPDAYGFLETLIAHDKDICGVLYHQREGECAPVLMTAVGEHGYRFLRPDELTNGLQRVDVAGGGCLLVKMKVFERIAYPYFSAEHEFGTDVQLCRAAIKSGFEVWADTSIEFGHLRQQLVAVTSRNRHQFQMSDAMPGEVKRQFVASDVYDRLKADVATYLGASSFEQLLETVDGQSFLEQRKTQYGHLADLDWYRTFGKERVVRQVWYNTQHQLKRQMTQFILASVDHTRALDVLDFGCGIGIPAYTFAEKGHRVTGCDVRGTGTLEFLKWRAKTHNVPLTIHETETPAPPLGDAMFDVIVAMDCLEHIETWRDTLRVLCAHLKPGGAFFANNAILEDDQHQEHYHIDHREFVAACLHEGLLPINQFVYSKPATAGKTPGRPAGVFAHA